MSVVEKFKKIFNKNIYMTKEVIYKNSTSKYSVTADCTMELSSKTEEKKNEINNHLNQLVKKYIENPEKLIQYVSLKEIEVCRIDNADKILNLISEEQGFITPLNGLNALFLNFVISLLTKKEFSLKLSTKEMMIFDKSADVYTIARAIHKYYGYKHNLPGFDKKSQKIFKKIYRNRNSKCINTQIENASLKDIFACRDALKRDLESINFTLQLSLEHERSKKALNKIIKEKNAKI